MSGIRVLIVDDHPVVRQGIRSLLSNRRAISVVGEATGVDDAVAAYEKERPDVTLLDMRLADGSGLDALVRILDVDPQARVLMLSSFDDEEYVTQALKAGAFGYVLKSDSDSILVNAIETVAGGRHTLSPRVTDQIIGQLFGERSGSRDDLDEQDRDILRMVAKGASNSDIAKTLFVSEATVKRRLRAIFTFLGVGGRAAAAAEAARRGLL